MKFIFTAIGKNNEKFIDDACTMYLKRLRNYYKVEFNVIHYKSKSKAAENMKAEEAKLLLQAIEKADFTVLLDEKGKKFNSLKFADFIQTKMNHSLKSIQFIVGGAYGFDAAVYQKADLKISLSDMTFSHQIIRILFFEQLYRAISIIHRLPYHNEG